MLKAFALASAIGGVAGFLVLSANQQVTPMLGMWATLKGLIAMMIGGLGSIPGAIVGGLVLGVIEVHSQTGCSGRRFGISSPMACCSSCWCCGRAASSASGGQ